ncbi:SDR family NAD(P)-dependent oxidoreductase [Oscillatoria sp. CS-180]|uniref:SDR family NAD(P)-dependent oxidoreductase n=1 Tax=Oscillatoria sp. CS-180 TaxID=3021720 RepID=UPI00232C1BCA|nr:SDR family oxidoreductase [Oscillatoria sp. CS-180]MDB9529277.1 SDR family NAD(P)-dependent oxidoreductase [Oscillatoria sp. CS-180]
MASTVLITGASQGIGRAIATQFARHGFNVVMAARQGDRLQQAAAELQAQHHSSLAIPTDVRDPEQVKVLVQKTLAQFGTVDVLVNNAGIYISGPASQFSLDDWHQAIDTNLWGYIHTIHALLPHFEERRNGTIVNVCSIGGKIPLPYLAPYTTSKFAIAGLTQSLQAELEHKGIHVCGIYPNIIKSSFLDRAIFKGNSQEDMQQRREQVEKVLQVPLVETPDKVAEAVWDAVENKRGDVTVGSAKLSEGSYRIFPQGLRWMISKVFQNQD